jgi:hypothetical protein
LLDKVSPANVSIQDIASTVDGTAFAVRTANTTAIRDSGLYVTGVPTAAELNQIPGRVAVPGLAMHPSGALIYQPFLTGAAGAPNVRAVWIFLTRVRANCECGYFCRSN